MAKKKKFYAVREGRTTGIFTSWAECSESVQGFSGAAYKSFETLEEAQQYMGQGQSSAPKMPVDELLVAYTDGSWSGRRYGWGVLIVEPGTGETHEFYGWGDDPDLASANNVAGETIAALRAMQYAIDNGYDELILRHDYTGVRDWATGAWAAKTPVARQYVQGISRIKDAGLRVRYEKVKGHSGNWGNEQADQLAAKGAAGDVQDIPEAARAGRTVQEPAVHGEPSPAPEAPDVTAIAANIETMRRAAGRIDELCGRNAADPDSMYSRIASVISSDRALLSLLEASEKTVPLAVVAVPAPSGTAHNAVELCAAIGARIRSARQKAKLNQSEVAAAVGIKAGDISRMERGLHQPELAVICNIAEFVGCTDIPELNMLIGLDGAD